MVQSRQYGRDVLAPQNRKPKPGQGPVDQVEAEPGLVVEDFEARFCGAVVALEKDAVTLEDRHGKRRVFPIPGPVPARRPAGHPGQAATGRGGDKIRIFREPHRVRVGRRAAAAGQGRQGQPDLRRGQARRRAGGEDLGRRPARRRHRGRVPGGRRRPGGHRRRVPAGAAAAARASSSTTSSPGPRRAGSPPPWPATRTCSSSATRSSTSGRRSSPPRLGLKAWPDVPRGLPWKEGVLRRIGWAHETPADVAARLAAHPALGDQLRRPGAGTARPGRGAHRLRHRRRTPADSARRWRL